MQIIYTQLYSFKNHHLVIQIIVAYWPPTRPSCQNKKCTCVNNRCIRSKISGDNLDCRRVELSVNCDARKKWVDIKLLYNPGDRKLRSIAEMMLEWELWPPQAPGWAGELERNAAMARRVGEGSICCSSVQSPTHLSHTITLSNKARGVYIFLKNCVPLCK